MSETSYVGSMSSSSRRAIIGSIAVSIAFVMELTLVPLLLPAIQEQFSLSIGQLAWVFNSYGIAVAAGVLLGGLLGDVLRTKRVFSAGVLMFAAGSATVATAGTFEMIIAGRVLQGFGGGVFSPLIPLLLTRSAPDRPGKVLIVWGSVAGYVAAFAPFLYGITLAVQGWNLAFLIFAVVSLGALVIVNGAKADDEPKTPPFSKDTYSKLLQTPGLWVMYVYIFCTYGSITFFLFSVPLWLSGNDYQVSNIG
ncbi:MAG: MFS transporter, partial [Boseongicola sp.]|nr:MFS transporter [Boseongicola sp.]